jgi:hypothetical protein
MTIKLIDYLSKYIKSVEIDGNTIINNGKNIKIVEVVSKYSSVKKPTSKIEVDDKICKRGDRLTYCCPMCNSDSTILVGRFLSKKSKYCYKCKENNEEKRKKQSEFIIKSYADFNKVVSLKNKNTEEIDIIKLSEKLFESESQEFKTDYFKRNLTIDEFDKIRENIKSVNGVDILNKKIEYYPHIKVNNQVKYSSKIFVDNEFVLFTNCEFCCEICGDDFKGRNLKKKINKILCPSCNFSNKVFKFKSTPNIKGEKVVYQSNPELKLINFLNDNNILIKNGPKIEYIFKGNKKIYKVDFEIPIFKHLIEIKGNHIWHKEQVDSGKWEAKESSAIRWCNLNSYSYKLIFNVDDYINNLQLNENWNPAINKDVVDFIDRNKTRLLHLWDKDKSEEENMDFLTNYFTENPQLMNDKIDFKNITSISPQSGIKNMAPKLMNIGGVKDFRSF